ncbi:MAG: hypothetical protein JWR75_2067 [Devosia sp.]|nr:hypothetical protein [Devosia sp.]
MQTISRYVVIAGAVGGVAAGLFMLPDMLPAAFAKDPTVRFLSTTGTDFLTPQGFSAASLIKIGESRFRVGTEPWVDTDAQAVSVVRKIGYGHTTWVNITTTNTGVYSTDALASPHVQYPGVEVSEIEPQHFGGTAWFYVDGTGWMPAELIGADSFVGVPKAPGSTYLTEPQ